MGEELFTGPAARTNTPSAGADRQSPWAPTIDDMDSDLLGRQAGDRTKPETPVPVKALSSASADRIPVSLTAELYHNAGRRASRVAPNCYAEIG